VGTATESSTEMRDDVLRRMRAIADAGNLELEIPHGVRVDLTVDLAGLAWDKRCNIPDARERSVGDLQHAESLARIFTATPDKIIDTALRAADRLIERHREAIIALGAELERVGEMTGEQIDGFFAARGYADIAGSAFRDPRVRHRHGHMTVQR
jgi:hypothetical protein